MVLRKKDRLTSSFLLLLTTAMLVLASSCGKDDGEEDPAATNFKKQLVGEWLGDCRDLLNGSYDQAKFTFEESGGFQFFETIFSDSECGNASEAVLSSSGSFTLADKEDANGNLELDLKYEVYQLTPSKESFATSMNGLEICGLTGWQFGESQSVAGLSCTYFDGTTAVTYPAKGATIKDLVLVSGTQAWIGGWFQFGSARPTTVNRDRPLRKR